MKRVCLVRMSAMGDVVQSLGAVAALAATRPELELHFVTQTTFVPLLEGLGFASVIGHERHGGVRGLYRTARAMRQLVPDCAVDLQGNWKSAMITRLAGARRRIGASGSHRQEPASAMLLNERVRIDGPRHPAVVALELLSRVAELDLPSRLPQMVASEHEVTSAAESVRAAGLDPTKPFSVFVFTDPDDNRSWRIAGMLRQVGLETHPVLWLRGPAESEVPLPDGVSSITHGAGEVRNLVGLGFLLAAVGGRALGPDQGATHVFAACGVETLAFFGPQDPLRTSPPAARVLLAEDGPDCMPCRSRECGNPDGPVCMAFAADQSRELASNPSQPGAVEL